MKGGGKTKAIDLSGKTFGRLTVIKGVKLPGRKGTYWECVCSCGTDSVIRRGDNLKTLKEPSCGCVFLEHCKITGKRLTEISRQNALHGKSRTKEYRIWSGIRQRCYDKTCKGYPYYGGKGVKMHQPWYDDFTVFLDYVGICPDGLSIDRIDFNGNYEPGNVRWATAYEQGQNRGPNSRNKSGKKGVFKLKSGRFQATLTFEGVVLRLGSFDTFEEAKKAREDAELEYLGEIKGC